nr:hypothetical protein [Eubacterium sp.]
MISVRKTITGALVLILLLLPACSKINVEEAQYTELNSGKETVSELPAEEYEYPAEFSLTDNLRAAITQLAISYDHFDRDTVKGDGWKELFIARFIQNSRMSYDYLDRISEQNDGQIGVEDLNYIQYSLTHTESDFSTYVSGSIDSNQAASSVNYGQINNYDYSATENGVILTADLEEGYDGTEWTQKREITVELVKNPQSCFDGYSVVSLSSQTKNAEEAPDHKEHVFCGGDMMEEDNGVFPFEFLDAEDELEYQHFVYIDLTELPEMAEFVRENKGKNFKVVFVWDEADSERIGKVIPT